MRIDDGPIKNGMPPMHPGEFLVDELVEMGLSTGEFATALSVPEPYFKALLQCDEDITVEMALRLHRYFGGGAALWINLQNSFELRLAELQKGEDIERQVQPRTGVRVGAEGDDRLVKVDDGLFENRLPPIHPGRKLAVNLRTIGMSGEDLDAALAVSPGTVAAAVHGRSSITAELALRLSHYFDTAARFWTNLQSAYDLKVALKKVVPKIEKQVQPRPNIPMKSEDWDK